MSHSQVRTVVTGMAAITAGLLVISYVGLLTLRLGEHQTYFQLFHVGDEGNVPTWWNSGLLALIGLTAWVCRLIASDPRRRRAWAVIAVVGGLLSVDEAARLHERSSALVQNVSIGTFRWVIVGAVVAVLGVMLLVWASRPLAGPLRRRLALGLGLYLTGALGFEVVSGYYTRQLRPFRAAPFTHIEEGLEMAGCIVALSAILNHLVPLTLGRVSDLSGQVDGPGPVVPATVAPLLSAGPAGAEREVTVGRRRPGRSVAGDQPEAHRAGHPLPGHHR